MRFISRWPFLTVAAATLVIGGLWHWTTDGSRSGVVFWIVSVLGAPFIAAMRWATRAVGWSPPYTQLVGFVLGLVPYVVAELLLKAVRRRRRAASRQVT